MYKTTKPEIWKGRIDASDGRAGFRWHQLVRRADLQNGEPGEPDPGHRGIAILGFCCDEGVKRNKGRTGAVAGPDAIRAACANLPDHIPANTELWDAGNLFPELGDLEKAQTSLGDHLADLLESGYLPLVLGGGHELAYGCFLGLVQHINGLKRLGIINFDAHYDLRLASPSANSGTSFYQMSEWCQQRGLPFHYLCIGVQEYSNTRALFQRAEHLGVESIRAAELQAANPDPAVARLDLFLRKVDMVYMSICLDVFNAAHAPGVSAPNPGGVEPAAVIPLIRHIARSGKLACADVAELNPTFDVDQRTARLASYLVFELTRAW